MEKVDILAQTFTDKKASPSSMVKVMKSHKKQRNITAIWISYLADWAFAFFVSALILSAQKNFLMEFVLPNIPKFSHSLFNSLSSSYFIILTPLCYLTHTYVTLVLGGQTFGMRLFKHSVFDSKHHHAFNHGGHFLWCFTHMVGVITMGAVLFSERSEGQVFVEELTGLKYEYHNVAYDRFAGHLSMHSNKEVWQHQEINILNMVSPEPEMTYQQDKKAA